jgi:hypothetical protein
MSRDRTGTPTLRDSLQQGIGLLDSLRAIARGVATPGRLARGTVPAPHGTHLELLRVNSSPNRTEFEVLARAVWLFVADYGHPTLWCLRRCGSGPAVAMLYCTLGGITLGYFLLDDPPAAVFQRLALVASRLAVSPLRINECGDETAFANAITRARNELPLERLVCDWPLSDEEQAIASQAGLSVLAPARIRKPPSPPRKAGR